MNFFTYRPDPPTYAQRWTMYSWRRLMLPWLYRYWLYWGDNRFAQLPAGDGSNPKKKPRR